MLDILILLLILAGAWLQSRHGIFQALVTLFSAFVAVVVSLNLYQYLSTNYFSAFPTYADGVSLSLLFVIVFSALRYGLQMLVSHDIYFGKWPDRIGGGIVGVFSGLMIGGVLAVVAQTLPVGESAMGCQPYDGDLKFQGSALLGCDRMVLSMASSASDAMGGGDTFAKRNGSGRELLLTLQAKRNTAGQVLREPPTDSKLLRETRLYRINPKGPGKVLARVSNKRLDVGGKTAAYLLRQEVSYLLVPAGERDENDKRLEPWWRLPGTHFALEAVRKTKGQPDEVRRFYPVAYAMLDDKGQWKVEAGDRNLLCIARPQRTIEESEEYMKDIRDAFYKNKTPEQRARLEKENTTIHPKAKDLWLAVDWVYCLPEGFTPRTVIFRNSSSSPTKDVLEFDVAEPNLRRKALRPIKPQEKKRRRRRG